MQIKILVLFMALALNHEAVAKKGAKTAPAPKASACAASWAQVFATAAAQKMGSGPLISLSPLRNDTDLAGDEWIGFGLSFLLSRYLATDGTVTALIDSQAGLAQKKPQYKIDGLFQHTNGWLRIFVQLKSAEGELSGQWSVETPYPLHKQFFTGLNGVAQNILAKLGSTKINARAMTAIQNETDKVVAYENFIKGKMALEKYDPNQIEVATIWFEESIREDGRYTQPYFGLMDAYGFSSLVHKQKGEAYSQDLETLQETFQMLKKKSGGSAGENRFLAAHVHYVTGIRAFEAGNAAKAAAELQQAADLVPEDGVTAYALSQSYDKIGQPGLALKYRQRAKGSDSCL